MSKETTSNAPVKTLTPKIKVRATMPGHFGNQLRKTGDEFYLTPFQQMDKKTRKMIVVTAEDQFSHEWMERIDGGPVPPQKRVMPDDIIPPPPPPSKLENQPSMPGAQGPIPVQGEESEGSQGVI